jgi:elongation factor Ts
MISASDIAKLRAQTGAGMMDCKNALEEAGGDMDKAGELLRKKGVIKAAKRADKVAADGLVTAVVSADQKSGVLVEVNCETDFVAKSEDFQKFSKEIAELVLKHNPKDLLSLHTTPTSTGKTVEGTAGDLTMKIGEKISIRRFERIETSGIVAVYLHGTKIGALVELTGGDATLGGDIAMHIAASNPKYLNREQVTAAEVDKEKAIYTEQLAAMKKPANIIENIVKGKLDKFYGEICLLEQQFIKDEEKTVKQLLDSKKAVINRYVRFELGEGIEKVVKDFAAEVAAQIK